MNKGNPEPTTGKIVTVKRRREKISFVCIKIIRDRSPRGKITHSECNFDQNTGGGGLDGRGKIEHGCPNATYIPLRAITVGLFFNADCEGETGRKRDVHTVRGSTAMSVKILPSLDIRGVHIHFQRSHGRSILFQHNELRPETQSQSLISVRM